jgi:type 1 glutamine amidotransferase
MSSMNRRDLLSLAALAGAGLAFGPLARSFGADDATRKKVLFFTKSSGFPHSVVTRKDGQLAHAERLLIEFGAKAGFDVTCTKDGSIFTPDQLKAFDAIAFYTTEDLTTNNANPKQPKDDLGNTMPKDGPQALFDFVKSGKGFIGFHCASDTFHSPNYRDHTIAKQATLMRDAGERPADVRTPYIKMLGGEFIVHQSQQKATQKVVDDKFPGLEDLKDFNFTEEWYALANFSDDLHVLLVQDTDSMKEKGEAAYKRPPYPSTWAKPYGQGRVFYTNMGHREDVWTNDNFQKVVVAGLNWITGKTKADVTPNVNTVCPQLITYPSA